MPIIKKYRAIADTDIPASIARDTETAAAIAEHEAKNFPHRPLGIEFAYGSSNYLDFHTGPDPAKDFDGRIIVSGGGASNGLAEALFQFVKQIFAGSTAFGLTGTPISRVLSATQTLDPPAVAAGATWSTTVAIAGAAIGDCCLISVTTATFFGFPFQINATILSTGVITIYLRNLGSTSADLAAFNVRIVVISFSQ